MTICVGVQVNECLVFAADSAVTLHYGTDPSGREIINVLPHGHKVFNLHRELPVCAMFCGLGNIGAASMSSLAKDFRIALMRDDPYKLNPEKYSIEEVAIKARKFLFEERYQTLVDKPSSDFSFYLGGYSSGAETPERWLMKIDGTTHDCAAPVMIGDEAGVCWGGQPEAIYRLLMGVSMQHRAVLAAAGLDAAQVDAASTALLNQMQVPFVHAAMPVQDAIDLADFLVETTKRFVRFLPGADTVGGETDIAVITKHEGFKWVRRKHFFASHLNPSEVSYGSRYPVEGGKPGHAAPRDPLTTV